MDTQFSENTFNPLISPKATQNMYFTDNSSYTLVVKPDGIERIKAAITEKLCEGEDAVRQAAHETFTQIARAAGNALQRCTKNAVNACHLGSTKEDFAGRIIENISRIENEYYQISMAAADVNIEVIYEPDESQSEIEFPERLRYNEIDSMGLGIGAVSVADEESPKAFDSEPLRLEALEKKSMAERKRPTKTRKLRICLKRRKIMLIRCLSLFKRPIRTFKQRKSGSRRPKIKPQKRRERCLPRRSHLRLGRIGSFLNFFLRNPQRI